MREIKLSRRIKCAGDVHKALIECGWNLEDATSFVNRIPDADAVEVVRCKDCKYSGMYAFGDGSEGETLACLDVEYDGFVSFATSVDLDHFCSYGERRSE